jgi:FMN-dependent NADH-azoreductase
MKKILIVSGSLKKENSNTNKQLEKFIEIIKNQHPSYEINFIKLVEHKWGDVWPVNAAGTFDNQEAANAAMESDLIVFGSPMYNFSYSAILKNFMDHIAIPRLTFRYKYTTKNVEGLLKKPYIILGSRGGFYSDLEKAREQSIPLMKPYDTNVIDYYMQDYLGCHKIAEHIAEGMNIKSDDGVALNTMDSWLKENESNLVELVKNI